MLELIVIGVMCGLSDGDEVLETGSEAEAPQRRMSETNPANQKLPIPPASSFFIFSQTNR